MLSGLFAMVGLVHNAIDSATLLFGFWHVRRRWALCYAMVALFKSSLCGAKVVRIGFFRISRRLIDVLAPIVVGDLVPA